MTRLGTGFYSVLALALATVFACGLLSAQQLQTRPRYQLHSGDQIAVHYPLTPEFDQQITIQPDGYVVLTMGGEAKVAGLTLGEATDLIKKNATVRLMDPEVHLALMDFQHPYFVVAGEVNAPNRYELREDTTALQALMLAGGARISSKPRQVLLIHGAATGQPTVRTLDMRHINSKFLAENPLLVAGDIVYVPRNTITNVQQWATLFAPFTSTVAPTADMVAH